MAERTSRIFSVPEDRSSRSVMGCVAEDANLRMPGVIRIDLRPVGNGGVPGGQVVLVSYLGDSWARCAQKRGEQN